MTCIYCSSTRPFTDEHVIPAGLGGDDRAWLLKGIVCGRCNTTIFSPLEAKLMRASPLAMARLFLQSSTRDRGGPPMIQASVSYFDDPTTGLLLEQEFHGGTPVVLAQVVGQPPDMLSVSAPDVAGANALVSELAALGDILTIVEKHRTGPEVRFDVSTLAWREERYGVDRRLSQSVAPKGAIWLEPLIRPATASTSMLTARVFKRSRGGLVCRAGSVDQAALFLTTVRANHASIVVPAGTVAESFAKPAIHLRQDFDGTAYDRVMTKIAVNLCAHLFGADAVRDPVFDVARRYARDGEGRIRKWPADVAEAHAAAFPKLAHHHLLIVTAAAATECQPAHLVVVMRYYGGPIEALIVAEGMAGVPACPEPILVVVDYETNVIERLSLEEFCAFALRTPPPQV